MEWKWVEGGVQFDGKMHAFTSITPFQAKAVVEGMERLIDVISILRNARQSFLEGAAQYRGAGQNLGYLLQEIQEQEGVYELGYTGLGSLFVPPLPVETVPEAERAKFTYETLLRIADRANKAIATPAKLETPAPEK